MHLTNARGVTNCIAPYYLLIYELCIANGTRKIDKKEIIQNSRYILMYEPGEKEAITDPSYG